MDRVIRFREEAAGSDKQAAGVAVLLHVFRQHVIARQQLLLRAQVLIQQQLAAPVSICWPW